MALCGPRRKLVCPRRKNLQNQSQSQSQSQFQFQFEEQNLRFKKKESRAKSAKKCTRCRKSHTTPNKKYCLNCLEYSKEKRRKFVEKRKKNGKCIDCGKIIVELNETIRCKACNLRHAKNAKNRREKKSNAKSKKFKSNSLNRFFPNQETYAIDTGEISSSCN
jgi:hypothetical protein